MTEDYCKLVSGIILSTIWREDDHTRILWITMLAVKSRDHRVLASIPGLAAVANIPVESCRAGLAKLSAPDPDSRTKEHEGRRIAEVEGGWLILNGEKYRNFLSKQERNEYQAKLMAERRKVAKLAPVSTKLAQLAQAEAEADTKAKAEGRKKKGISVEIPDGLKSDQFLHAWCEWQDYRRQAKLKSLTPIGSAKQLKALEAMGTERAIAAINFSIQQNYQGIFEPNGNGRGRQQADDLHAKKNPEYGW